MTGEKPLHWVGSSKRDFLAFPAPVQSHFGYALSVVQLGGKHPNAKPWKGEGPGVFEVVETSTAAERSRCRRQKKMLRQYVLDG
jgi:phage-related protein